MDHQWQFAREWERMKQRVESLERKVYWLEQYKKKQEDKERASNIHTSRN